MTLKIDYIKEKEVNQEDWNYIFMLTTLFFTLTSGIVIFVLSGSPRLGYFFTLGTFFLTFIICNIFSRLKIKVIKRKSK